MAEGPDGESALPIPRPVDTVNIEIKGRERSPAMTALLLMIALAGPAEQSASYVNSTAAHSVVFVQRHARPGGQVAQATGPRRAIAPRGRSVLAQFGQGAGNNVPQAAAGNGQGLADLIQTVVAPQSWERAGGPGTIAIFGQ